MKIVFLNPSSKLGGAERCLVDMMSSLRRTDEATDLHLIVPEHGPLVDEIEQCGATVTILPIPDRMLRFGDSRLGGKSGPIKTLSLIPAAIGASFSGANYLRRLRSTINKLKPDIVHSNGIKCHLLSRAAGIDCRKTVWHVHDFFGARPLASRLLRWASTRHTRAIAVSQAVEADTRSAIPALRTSAIYNAIDVETFSPGTGDGRVLDGLASLSPAEPDVVRVGLIATYARWKGLDLFLEAAARLVKQRLSRPVRFYLIGGPIYDTSGSQFSRTELEQLAMDLGILDRVGLVPFQNRPVDVYRSLDVVVHASTKPEPFGRTIVEAMACGRAVIVSEAGGAAELFRPNETAIGVPPRDANALAAAIARLAENAGLRETLGENARRHAVSRFANGRLGTQLLSVYEGAGDCGVGVTDAAAGEPAVITAGSAEHGGRCGGQEVGDDRARWYRAAETRA